jgi:glyoxylase-like metal-dependent hydrolase (beta-lactamase superfamily II)
MCRTGIRSQSGVMKYLLFMLVAGCAADAKGVVAPAPKVHQIQANEAGLLVNGYLVEGAHGVVAVDSALTITDSRRLRKEADALGKPLLAVLITHGHPDHYNGVAALISGHKVAVYATAPVAKVIRDDDAAKEKQWKPVFKDEWPAKRAFPDHEVKDGEKLTFDGMTFVAHELGPAESHADSYWELTGAGRAVFIGDEVLNGAHAYTNDGHTAAWLANLDRLAKDLAGVAHVYPGHGAAGDASLFAWEKTYLTTYRAEVDKLRGGADTLSDAQRATLVEHMKAAYPKAALEFMIALGANTVAAELAHGHGR